MEHDLSFNSGERQTASTYEEVRADHRYRYEWASNFIPEGTFGLDVFCGNGYGAWLLGQSRYVFALDGSIETVNFATKHFSNEKTRFSHAYWPFELPRETFEFIVTLESVEHVLDGDRFFRCLAESLKPGGVLIYSTPNEDLLPHVSTGNHFHFRHYTLTETLDLAEANSLSVLRWAGQNTYYLTEDGHQGGLLSEEAMVLLDGQPGQFSIVACTKKKP